MVASAKPGIPPALHLESEEAARALVDGAVERLRNAGVRAGGEVGTGAGSTARELLEIVAQVRIVEEDAEASIPPSSDAEPVFDENEGSFSETIGRHRRALVGRNESGKTAILKALWKSRNVAEAKFDKLYDFPRDRYPKERSGSQVVSVLEFSLSENEAAALAAQFGLPHEIADPDRFYPEAKPQLVHIATPPDTPSR